MPNGDNTKKHSSLILPAEAKQVIGPREQKRILKLTNDVGVPVHVVEVPDCRFNGITICLSTKKPKELRKLLAMSTEFRRWFHEVAQRFGSRA